MDEIEKIKRKIRQELEENMDIDDSDIPVHEKFVREEHIKKLKKR